MQETSERRKYDGATARAIQIGLFLVPVNVYWVTLVEMKYRAEATALPIFIYPIFHSVLPCRFQQLPIKSMAADLFIPWGAAYHLFHARDLDLNRVVWDVAGSVRVLPSPVSIHLTRK